MASRTHNAASRARFAAIYAVVLRIPRGRVATYGAIAELAGLPRRARLAGAALRNAPASLKLPWHRVIAASGRLAFPFGGDAYEEQRKRLAREGVVFVGRQIDLRRYGWPDREAQLDELLWRPERTPRSTRR